MKRITIIPVGTPVIVGKDIDAMILSAMIGDGDVCYNVAWWDGKNRIVCLVAEAEVTVRRTTDLVKIGFVKP